MARRLAALLCVPCVLFAIATASGQATFTPLGNDPTLAIQPTDHEQIVCYWTAEGGWHSELQLRNNLSDQDLTVVPVLRSADGEEAPLPAVTIKPQEVRTVDIRASIDASAPQMVSRYGSLAIRYHSLSYRNLYAALMVHDTGRPIAFHIDALGKEDYETASREGIWWLPNEGAKDILILTNEGNETLDVVLSLYDAQGHETVRNSTLGPRQTERYSVRQIVQESGLSGSFGGIRVYAPAHAGSLDTLHALYDESAGFSALLKMFDHDPKASVQQRDYAKTSKWTLRAPMLALISPDPALHFPAGTVLNPQLFVRNTTGKSASAVVSFHWRSDTATGTTPGPNLILKPYETRRVDVAALQTAAGLPLDANWASVYIETDTKPEEVMAVAASYDKTLRYGTQTPFSDQLSHRWEGGRWQVDSMHDSIITAGNGGLKPTNARFTIFYNQGRDRYDIEQQLQPDEQMWIDVAKLIREGIPDKTGKTLPADLEVGAYEFNDLVNHGVGALFEGKVIYDKTFGHVAYGCAACCAYRGPHAIYNPLGLAVASLGLNGVDALDVCGGGQADISGDFWNWNTTYPSIAKTDVYGHHTGMSLGTTPAVTSGQYEQEGSRLCILQSAAPTTSAAVRQPYATSIVGSTYTGLESCGNGTALGHERDVWEQIVDSNKNPFTGNGVTVSETVSPTSRDDFKWGNGLQTGSGPTSYQNAPGTARLNGVIEDRLFNCDAVLLKCQNGGGGGLESILTQQDAYAGIALTTQNSLVEICTGFTVNGK